MVRQIIIIVLLISTIFGYPIENGQKEDKSYRQQMFEKAGLHQGDIMLTEKQKNMINMKVGLIDEIHRWPKGVVPYDISAGHFSQSDINVILSGMSDIENRTCIRFRQRTNSDLDYVRITGDEDGCYSYLGRVGGAQVLNLGGAGCIFKETAIHELTHALGFSHMQCSFDRDSYVVINWQNIDEEYHSQFEKESPASFSHFGGSYDYDSIMHYEKYAFTMNGQPTITPLNPNANIGSALHLSQQDANKINNMYKC